MKFVDKGWGNLLKRVEELAKQRVEVGAIGPEAKKIHPHRAASRWRVTVAEALAINEFGTGAGAATHVPARSPLRRTFSPRSRLVKELGVAAGQVLGNLAGTSAQVLGVMGRLGVEALRNTLAGDNPPGNADLTVKRKGFDHPLIWTGMLYEAIASRVVDKKSDDEGDAIIEIGGEE